MDHMNHSIQSNSNGFFSDKKLPVTLSILILIIGSIIYFSLGGFNSEMSKDQKLGEIFKEMQIKAAYTSEGQLKVFVIANNNKLINYKSSEGESLPESNTIIIGSDEANVMRSEKLFSKIGDQMKEFFGVNVTIGGILEKTNSPLDKFHFVSEKTFSLIEGEEDIIFIKMGDKELPRVFYTLQLNSTSPIKLELNEGNLNDYKEIHIISGEKYYPIILGSDEAEIMRSERLFTKVGDTVKGLFGKNFIVSGILSPTNSSLDIIYIVPLNINDLMENSK